MAKLVVEVLNLIGHVSERHKFAQLPIKIGRGYDNDLILSDLHVSPEHVILHEDPNGWVVEDLGSENGVQIKPHTTPSKPNHMSSGDGLIIGRTRLRFYSPGHPVPATHALPASEKFSKIIGQPRVTILIALLALIVFMTNQQLASTKILPIEKLIAASLPPLLTALIWGGIWSFAGRVIKHKADFNVHFSVAILFALVLILIQILTEYATYNSHSILLASLFEFLFIGLAIALLLNINIHHSTSVTRKTRLITSHAVSWGILILAIFLQFPGKPDFRPTPHFPSTLKPPFAKLSGSQTLETFLVESEQIFLAENHE